MSGHSKWANIKHKKGKADAARGKIFTKIGREIAIAVREGGANPENNNKLRDIIAKAKANNMPNDNIQRSIKKAAGEGTGATYEELAAACEIDAANFAATMEAWNGYVEAKNDPDFGRVSFTKPLNNAPYYAVKVTAGIHHTMGGLKINTETQVLTAEGTAIPGLYAAGEVTGGVHGANRLGGNAVCDFVVFGRIAGAEAAEYVK